METISIEQIKNQTGIGFGTSGVRGLVSDLNDRIIYIYTRAFLKHMYQNGDLSDSQRNVAIAGDLRSSTRRLLKAAIKAIEDAGAIPIFAGFIPTPAVTLYGIDNRIPSIMVTGSHIPEDRNGIKYNKARGEILKSDEEIISQLSVDIDELIFDSNGYLIDEKSLPEIDYQAENNYIKRYVDFFGEERLLNLNIGLYQHSAVGRDILLKILQSLGANVKTLGRSDVFIPVDTEKIEESTVRIGHEASKLGLDALVTTDGDSDRPLIAPTNGVWIRADITGILTAQFLELDSLAVPISCNTSLEKSGVVKNIIRTKIGSPYVIEAMDQMKGKVGGYEANGGFFINSIIDMQGRKLSPLPTRDAFIVILSLLVMAKDSNTSIETLFNGLPKRYTDSDMFRGLNRIPSEPEIRTEVEKLTKISNSNFLDGYRYKLITNEFIHFRPSKNEPGLRCYVEADSPDRCKQLLDYGRKIIGCLVE